MSQDGVEQHSSIGKQSTHTSLDSTSLHSSSCCITQLSFVGLTYCPISCWLHSMSHSWCRVQLSNLIRPNKRRRNWRMRYRRNDNSRWLRDWQLWEIPMGQQWNPDPGYKLRFHCISHPMSSRIRRRGRIGGNQLYLLLLMW